MLSTQTPLSDCERPLVRLASVSVLAEGAMRATKAVKGARERGLHVTSCTARCVDGSLEDGGGPLKTPQSIGMGPLHQLRTPERGKRGSQRGILWTFLLSSTLRPDCKSTL
jgi:hypothetical protein